MNLEFWYQNYYSNYGQVPMEVVYEPRKAKTLLLVENQEEHDFLSAMQLILGSEIEIQIWDPERRVTSYLPDYSALFTTWDSVDRNRI